MSREKAAEALRASLALIDRLGEFFAAEHVWVMDRQVKMDWDGSGWEEKVNQVVDRHGFVIPEMYEALIHLAHAVGEILDEEES